MLVVNDDGLHLLTMRRKPLMTLSYTTLSDVSSCTVKIGALNHSAVNLANDGSPPLLLAFRLASVSGSLARRSTRS